MIQLKNIKIGNGAPFVLIAGPCVIENESITIHTAEEIKKITDELNIPYIFKSSYKKANRTSIDSFVGLDLDESLKIFHKIKTELNLPILTDVHTEREIDLVKDYVDVLQIPAFLCRQTELLIAAGKTGKVVNVKKGQFLAPDDMKHVVEKIKSTGNNKILLTERGTSFGYHNLIVDMRSLEIIMDATHAVQIPSQGGISGGEPRFIKILAKAAAAVGIDGLFLEVHPDPPKALSDSASQLHLSKLKNLLKLIQQIDIMVKNEDRYSE